ncbi:MAG TPA: hypothetical protein VN517_10920 [Terriglobales bacterium]|nr:hypothetical protein [Terriglobales bacterium]
MGDRTRHAQIVCNEYEAMLGVLPAADLAGRSTSAGRYHSAIPTEPGDNANTDGIDNGLELATSLHCDAPYATAVQRLKPNLLHN